MRNKKKNKNEKDVYTFGENIFLPLFPCFATSQIPLAFLLPLQVAIGPFSEVKGSSEGVVGIGIGVSVCSFFLITLFLCSSMSSP